MITFQYFQDCPNSVQTLDHLTKALGELGIPETELDIIEVPDIAHAETLRFQGSPTILVDGIDMYTKQAPVGFQYVCRMYQFDGKRTGVIPKEYMLNVIAAMRGRSA